MGVIVRPDDLGSIMAEVYARLDAIERTSGPMHDFAIRDPSGNMRVQGGNLAAWGISPAQEGMRVIDAFGNPIFDTLGLSQVMQVIGTCHPASGVGGFPAGGTITEFATDGHASFSVTRPTTVLVMCSITIQVASGGGIGPFVFGLGLDQTTALDADGSQGAMSSTTVAPMFPVVLFMVKQAAAGSHAISLLGQNTTGVVVTGSYGLMKVFQQGG